jgi:mannitol 2-dehydrogenase
MADVLHAQDFLYTVVERSATTRRARVIGSICDYLYAPASPAAVLSRMSSEDCRIVSMTVTEAGYFIDQGTGKFEEDHPDVRFDLDNPKTPRTFLGYLCESLEQRRVAGLPPFTVMSCDNLQGNGHATRQAVLGFAELRSAALRRWIEQNVTFPNSMVDRITPATTEVERKLIEERFGIRDGWPVITEPFRQWVIEDRFCNGRPPLEEVGVTLTDEVEPFEEMKMRLLNGSHFAMAYFSAMLGFEFVHECLEDALMRRFIGAYMEAVSPAVPFIPGVDLQQYKATLLERFSNPTIRDQITRICSGGSSKLPKFVLPVYPILQAKNCDTRMVALVVAGWLHYFRGCCDEKGHLLAVVDPCAAQLTRLVQENGTNPEPALAVCSIFGEDLPKIPRFVGEVAAAMESLANTGVAGTLSMYLEQAS